MPVKLPINFDVFKTFNFGGSLKEFAKIDSRLDNTHVTPYNKQDSKKHQVEQMFDNIAPRYDFLNHLLSANIDKLWRRTAVNLLRKKRPKSILDVATGTGDFAIALQRLHPDEIIGVDISENMLAIGRDKLKRKNFDRLISMQRGDSEKLPFPNNRFDAVTVAFGVRNFENLRKGISEMCRVLKPNGTLVVLEFSKPRAFPVKQMFYFYFNYVLPVIGRIFSKDQRAYTYLPESVRSFPDGEEFCKLLKEAGFKSVQCNSLTFGIASIYTGEKS